MNNDWGRRDSVGWLMGFEPTTTGITILDSTIELQPPLLLVVLSCYGQQSPYCRLLLSPNAYTSAVATAGLAFVSVNSISDACRTERKSPVHFPGEHWNFPKQYN